MGKKGVEVIIGLVKDQQFGKLILFGIGGFYSELIRDVTFKRIPIDRFDRRHQKGTWRTCETCIRKSYQEQSVENVQFL